MSWLDTIALAFAMGADPFALGLGVGMHCFQRRQVVRMGLTVGLFHFVMALAGWLLGDRLADVFSQLGPWLAFAVIGFFGIKLFIDSLRSDNRPMESMPMGRKWLLLCTVTSLDAFGIGFGLGITGTSMWFSALLIGLVTSSSAMLSMPLSCKLSNTFGSRLGMVCGVLMVVIAFRMLLG